MPVAKREASPAAGSCGEPRRPDQRAPGAPGDLAAPRWRFGYRQLRILIAREDMIMNHKKLRRLYDEKRSRVRRRGGRMRAFGNRASMALRQAPNQRRFLDFVSNRFTDGRRLRIRAVADDFACHHWMSLHRRAHWAQMRDRVYSPFDEKGAQVYSITASASTISSSALDEWLSEPYGIRNEGRILITERRLNQQQVQIIYTRQ